MEQANFLDVTLHLPSDKYWPYRKPNDTPLYVHAKSNPPPSIKKALPKMISRRISDLSCDEDQFKKHKGDYDTALKNSGYSEMTNFSTPKPKKRSRKRNIIWFNPPYSDNVDTNIGKRFFEIIDRNFPPDHKFRPILNRNSLKLSYSCMPNIKTIIASHNKQVLSKSVDASATKPCNCRVPADCPVGNMCQKSAVIYKATVESPPADKKEYVGLSEPPFKKRFYGHTHDMKDVKAAGTTLSKCTWSLKEANKAFTVKWQIIRQSVPYACGTRKCDLCLCEKLEIVRNRSKNLLNKRSEIVNKCRHSRKFKLCAVT